MNKVNKVNKLTIEKAKNFIDVIEYHSNNFDFEAAHSREDALNERFIEEFSLGLYELDEAIELSKIIKTTRKMDFKRYYS